MKTKFHLALFILIISAFIFLIFLYNNSLFALAKQDTKAIETITKMIHSLDHIKNIQCDVKTAKISPHEKISLEYKFYADKNNKASIMKDKKFGKYISNRKGYFIVRKEPVKQLPNAIFPFDLPNAFLKKMDLKDVTENNIFKIQEETANYIIMNMLPIGTGGKSIKEAMDNPNERVTKLTFTINKPNFTLKKVEIFKNFKDKATEYIEIDYGAAQNKALQNKENFNNKLIEAQKIVIVHTKSVTDFGKDEKGNLNIQIKEVWYNNIIINGSIDQDIFDEE